MKAKKKAQKMHDKYYFEIWNNVSFDDESEVYESAKQCALICMDEMIQYSVGDLIPFLEEVKQEIQKL